MTTFGLDGARWLAAAATTTLYGALCLGVVVTHRRKAAAAATLAPSLASTADAPARVLLIVHASQTGAAEHLACQAAGTLHAAGLPLRVAALGTLTPADLAVASTVLFVASTCGDGDAPDSAASFVRRFMDTAPTPSLAGLDFGLLALGDRGFAHFCAFGRRLDAWLAARGARPLFERIDVDALDPRDLGRWHEELRRLAGPATSPAPEAPVHAPWRLVHRTHLNPDSIGAPVFRLELEPPDGQPPSWASGDLVRIRMPGAPEAPRVYSIASIPAEGRVCLLVRQQRRPDGHPGRVSGWLTRDADIGTDVAVEPFAHRNFRLGDNAHRPLILVGNGTGIAGLRAHIAARAPDPRARHWLVFGERQAAHDFHFQADIQAWLASGAIARLDLAFSRDQAARRYVQDRLRAQADAVHDWLDEGAAVYVCGSRQGMATGVHQALLDIVGPARLQALIEQGRYRSDVY